MTTTLLLKAPIPKAPAQANGEIVLRDQGEGTHLRYVVHFHNLDDGGYYFGQYSKTVEEAEEKFFQKCKRYGAVSPL